MQCQAPLSDSLNTFRAVRPISPGLSYHVRYYFETSPGCSLLLLSYFLFGDVLNEDVTTDNPVKVEHDEPHQIELSRLVEPDAICVRLLPRFVHIVLSVLEKDELLQDLIVL